MCLDLLISMVDPICFVGVIVAAVEIAVLQSHPYVLYACLGWWVLSKFFPDR